MTDDRDRIEAALRCLSARPSGLGGLWLRARSGPVRDAVLAALTDALTGLRRIGPGTDDTALDGGLDVSASLAAGRRVDRAGLLTDTGPLLLTSAETCTAGRAARLARWLDTGGTLILLDEGGPDDAPPPDALTDRLALYLDLDGLRPADAAPDLIRGPAEVSAPNLTGTDLDHLVRIAAHLGVPGLRAPMLAGRVAAAHAAAMARDRITADDLSAAAALVYAHRATVLPQPDDTPEPQQTPDQTPGDGPDTDVTDLTAERMIEAARTALPPEVLADLAARRSRTARKGEGAGDLTLSTERGRPLPPRRGRPGGRARVDLIATLRAAAPWQRLRDTAPGRVAVRASDIHLRRHARRSSRLVIFVVDASGSAAMARMAEAKGAVGLLLAEAYRSRDSVALIAFRGESAEVLLPPTRALAAAKRHLSGLPGGGATPLAAALRQAATLADRARRSGTDPMVVLMSDGRGNRALDGSGDKAQAEADAQAMAAMLRRAGVRAICLDTGRRRAGQLDDLARRLDAPCLPLPRGGAGGVAALIG